MKIQIIRIADRGIANRERLHLRVLADTPLNYYVVFVNRYISVSPPQISSIPVYTFWFPPINARAGDNVVLYTGTGTQRSVLNAEGRNDHFFYWGLQRTVWNQTGDCAVLLEVSNWQTSSYE